MSGKALPAKMSTVFLSGSRRIVRLDDLVRVRLQRIVDQGFRVVVGDASGADKAMQSYLFEQGYSKVAVFCVGGRCRNNVGAWPVENVLVESGLKGRSPYTRRDEAMAEEADFGLVLWDGNSEGSFNNVLELLKRNKKVVVYFAPRQQFVNIKTREDVRKLLQFCESGAFHGFQRSLHLRRQMASLLIGAQTPLHLPD